LKNGWITTIKVSYHPTFSVILKIAEHLLLNDYKDATAVMIGGVWKNILRQLCLTNKLMFHMKDGKIIY
jgi:hypothetical protein